MDYSLLEKYNQPVPRYTSYPPANHFQEGFQPEDYLELIRASNSWKPENISVYIHIPFCRQLCLYCGCNSCPMPGENQIRDYVESIKKEMEIVLNLLDNTRKISQIHYGGGTPNAIPIKYLKELNQFIFDRFKCIDSPEIAIECHPGYLKDSDINTLIEAGFNRFSLGIQDFNEAVLHKVNRKPSLLPVAELINTIRKNREIAINLDFIYGLPGQSAESFKDTIDQAVDLNPDRLVTFSYAHVPWVNKNQHLLEKAGLPDSNAKLEMFIEANRLLLKNNYKMIGIDHYVLEHDELYKAQESGQLHRNFQGYASRRTTGQVYAFGISAISQLQQGYAQNTKSMEKYISDLQKSELPVFKGYLLNENENIVREAINELMCNKNLDYNTLAEQLKTNKRKILESLSINEEKLITFEKDGIINQTAESISITDKGIFFIRNVAASIDPLMMKDIKSYSKSI